MKKRKIPVVDIEKAKQKICDYCIEHNLDSKKIDRFQVIWDKVYALKESDVKPMGLTNDLETLPIILLYLDAEGLVHETEHIYLIGKK